MNNPKLAKILFILFLAVLCAFTLYKKQTQYDIVFEMSRVNKDGSVREPFEEYCIYYALKNNNVLVWSTGNGELNYKTYGAYFYTGGRKGKVKLTLKEALTLKKYLKKVIKYYDPVEPDYYIEKNYHDGSECVVSAKGKFYNQDAPKEQFQYNKDAAFAFYTLELQIQEYIDKYRQQYAEETEKINSSEEWPRKYDYLALQENED